MSRTFDAIELELLWRRLISLVDEAAAAMVRTSFSTLVRESYDFSCVVTDASGQSLVQASESIPSFIGTLPETHVPDIGGKIRSPEPREVFEEGLQIPPMKMMAAGKTDETLVALIRKNVRTPDQTMGDLYAQIVALDLMEDRLLVLMENYGLPDLTDLAREIQGRCEAAMRAAIRELPDGTYRSELKTDGIMDKPITIRMALTIKGDEILIDFAGTDAQVDRAINCAMCYTNAMCMYGVKVCTNSNLPNNEGAWRPITLTAPPGCIVNPQFPAPGGSRMLIGHYIPMLVFGFHHKQLRPDSGGAGRHRGGLGQEILIESRSETPIAVSFLAERTIFAAFGIEGGRDGAPGELRINGEKTDPKKQYVLNKGDTVSLGTPGGGGHGDPKLRSAAALAADVAAGYVTAASDYQGDD